MFRTCVERAPDDPEGYFYLGEALVEEGKLAEARQQYEKGLALAPGDVDGQIALGDICLELAEHEAALAAYRRAVELDPRNADGYVNIGLVYNSLEETSKAIEAFEKALEIDPANVFAYNGLGDAWYGLGEREKAIDAFRKGIELDPTDAAAHFNLGELYYDLGETEEAEKECLEAVRLDPGFAMARAALAEQDAALGLGAESRREAAAADSLARLLRDETQRLVVQLRVSQFAEPFLARRDSLLALAEQRAPDELLVAIARARTAEAREESAAEEAAWRRVLALDPNYANAYNQIGYIAAREGRYDEALNYLRKYVFLAPQLANPHDSLGEILFHAGRYEEAEQELWQALQIQPDFFPSLLTLGAIDMERGQVHKGVGLLEKVRAQIAGSDWEPQVDATIIQTYYDHDLRPQLVTAIERRLERYPDEYRRDRYRALLAILTGRWQEAPGLHAAFLATAREQAAVRDSPRQQERLRVDAEIIRAMIARERGDHRSEEHTSELQSH
mgnify:CR=1 FL=1